LRTILIWGLAADPPLGSVRAALSRIGAPVVFLDQQDVLGCKIELVVDCAVRGTLKILRKAIDLAAIGAVYVRPYDVRQIQALEGKGSGHPEFDHALSFEGALSCWLEMTPGLVVNRPSAMSSNNSKPYQMELIRAAGFDVPHGLRGAFREHADSSRTRVLQYRESRGARAQLLASQQAPDRDRRDRHAVPRELIAVPLRAACRPRQSKGDHPSLRLHRDRRRAAAPRLSALRMDPVGAVLFEARSQPIEHRPRHPMPAARFTDVPQLLGVAHHAQSLTVYAVLEGHRLIPFHVSPPRETRGRIGRLALLSFQRSNDSTC